MFTPQQIEQISFGTQTFGGYKMEDVDEFLEPLTEDYVTLYKENALLKSKMRVLVGKLEEYRKSEAAMKDAIVTAQKTCDQMVRDAEAKCAQMLSEANAAAQQKSVSTDALVAAEQARVEEARRTANAQIAQIMAEMEACMQALERIRNANASADTAPAAPAVPAAPVVSAEPAAAPAAPAPVFDFDAPTGGSTSADAVADEISQSLEAMIGTTTDTQPKAAPRHPTNDTTTSKFANLQFGRNYDPTHK